MLWGQPDSSSSWKVAGAAITGVERNIPAVHTDLTIASTNQLSWDGVTGTRDAATGDYCDKMVHHAQAATETYTFKTIAGL